MSSTHVAGKCHPVLRRALELFPGKATWVGARTVRTILLVEAKQGGVVLTLSGLRCGATLILVSDKVVKTFLSRCEHGNTAPVCAPRATRGYVMLTVPYKVVLSVNFTFQVTSSHLPWCSGGC